MKYKSGNTENRVYKNKPDGWRVDTEATAHPLGTVWIHNGKSRFPKNGKPSQRKKALLVTDEKAMVEKIASKRRSGQEDHFITDKTTEKKIQAEIRRQNREKNATALSKKPAVGKAATPKKPAAPKKSASRLPKSIGFVEKNASGAYVIHGDIGTRRYMGYTKREAIARYNAEAKKK